MKLYLLFVLLSILCAVQASSSDSLGSPLAANPRHLSWKERLAYYLCCCGCCKKQDRPEEDEDDQIVLDAKYELRGPVKKNPSSRMWYE